jgi:hypothetical protein
MQQISWQNGDLNLWQTSCRLRTVIGGKNFEAGKGGQETAVGYCVLEFSPE